MTNIGMSDESRKQVAEGLSHVLADTYKTYFKTHGYHWNVEGPQFKQLHDMFEEQYTEMWQAMDEIAERIRALDHYAPGSPKSLAKLSDVEEEDDVPEADEMLERLIGAHETTVKTIRTVIPEAQEAQDEVSVGLLVDRETVHEKTLWMLRSMTK